MKKLNFLMHNSLFPPETFQNLLVLYCKYQFFDLAHELMIENPKYCDSLLDKEDFLFLKTLVTMQISQDSMVNQGDLAQMSKEALHNYK